MLMFFLNDFLLLFIFLLYLSFNIKNFGKIHNLILPLREDNNKRFKTSKAKKVYNMIQECQNIK